MTLAGIDTPALLLEEQKLTRNVQRVHDAIRCHPDVALRPHFKTTKSIEVLERTFLTSRKATVSTLLEAEELGRQGVTDVLYAVGIVPGKLDRVAQLQDEGMRLTVILDDLETARAAADWAARRIGHRRAHPLPVIIEVDTDGHRAGVAPDGDALLPLAQFLCRAPGIEFAGVMTHAGAAYDCETTVAIVAMAEQERRGVTHAASRVRSLDLPCETVSLGSTPTVLFAESLAGVTEARVGVGYFNDLTMVGLGVCRLDDVAISVLTTVIGHQPDRNCLLIDAGWMALSEDRARASQLVFPGLGLAATCDGQPLAGVGVVATNQEHGIISTADGAALDLARFPIGSQLRILPNHACATAAGYSSYRVLDSRGAIVASWRRCSGW